MDDKSILTPAPISYEEQQKREALIRTKYVNRVSVNDEDVGGAILEKPAAQNDSEEPSLEFGTAK